jgi:hypothetical protein
MGSVTTTLEFLADLPIYKTEQPFQVIPSPDWPEIEPTSLSNIKLHQGSVIIHDLRDQDEQFTLDTAGFEFTHNEPQSLDFSSTEALEQYNRNTEDFMKEHFGAVFVRCFARAVSIAIRPMFLSNIGIKASKKRQIRYQHCRLR